MNLLHISFVPIELFGVRNKITAQIKAFRKNKESVSEAGYCEKGFFVDQKRIFPMYFTNVFLRKIFEIYIFLRLIFINYNQYDIVYIRYMRLTPWFYSFIKFMKNDKFKLVLEVATYPYDEEYKSSVLTSLDKYYRSKLCKYVDLITYFGESNKNIWGIPAIKQENGVDVDSVPLKLATENDTIINFIAVANLSEWHGYDRFIRSIAQCKAPQDICFNIVGLGPSFNKLVKLTQELNVENSVKFHQLKYGDSLTSLFNEAHIGVGSLGLYRIGHETLSPLKPAEYCARGLPFVLGNMDERFSDSPFLYRVSNDDTTFDIDDIVKWYKSTEFDPAQIRKFAYENLSWDRQVSKLIAEMRKS